MDKEASFVLDVQPLKKAIDTLEEAVDEFAKDTSNKFVRDACIQRFEYTYELSGKMLRRYLEMTELNPADISSMSFPHLIRAASTRQLLLHDWEQWSLYREARNTASHAYNEIKADKVVAIIPLFLKEAQYLLEKISGDMQA